MPVPKNHSYTPSATLKTLCAGKTVEGKPCKRPPMIGSTFCDSHGGMKQSPVDRFRNKLLQNADFLASTYGLPIEVTPEQALMEELYRTNGHILWLQERITESDAADMIRAMWIGQRTSGYLTPQELEEYAITGQAHLWMQLYLKEREHLLQLTTKAIQLGLTERQVTLQEKVIDQIGEAITGLLINLGVDLTDPIVRQQTYQALTQAAGAAQLVAAPTETGTVL